MTACAGCGRPLPPVPASRPGPRPRYCSPACRTRQWHRTPRAGAVVTLRCRTCAQPFEYIVKPTGRRPRYCSTACLPKRQRWNREPIARRCAACGAAFETRYLRQRFCSTACRLEARRG